MVNIDISGLEEFAAKIEQLKGDMPEINKEFMLEDFDVFKEKVVPISPVDTGHLSESYFHTPVRQEGIITEHEWYNNAGEHDYNPYASFVNYGTIRQRPQYFWERGLSLAMIDRDKRYQEKLKEKFESY